jgi:hypothetical protein
MQLLFYPEQISAVSSIDDQIWQVWINQTIRFPIPDNPVLVVSEQSQGGS